MSKDQAGKAIDPHQYRVLVVDDDKYLLDELKYALEDEGYGVVTAASGHDALSQLEAGHIDLVLSDVRMPNGDGEFLLRAVRKEDPTIPFLVMTGFSDLHKDDALNLGANAFFEKPLPVDSLFDRIEEEIQRVYAR